MIIQRIPERVVERVLSKVAMGPTGCHLSTYSVASHGYAQVGWQEDGQRFLTLCHLVAWVAQNGPVADGMTIDHYKCRNRRCMRVDHLRMISNLDNARRTSGRDWPLGECANGHPDELYWRPAGPGRSRGYCSECHREQNARWRESR